MPVPNKAQLIHKRAFVQRRAVAWCQPSSGGGTTSPDAARITCQRCLAMMGGVRVG